MRNRLLAINLALLLILSSLFMQAPSAEAKEADQITDPGTSISESVPAGLLEETTTGGSIDATTGGSIETTNGSAAGPAAVETKTVNTEGAAPVETELAVLSDEKEINVDGTEFGRTENKSGAGWNYDAANNILTLDNYNGSSIFVASGDLTVYCHRNVSVKGENGANGSDALSVCGLLNLYVLDGTASFTGGNGSGGSGGSGISAKSVYILNYTNTVLNATGGDDTECGAPGVYGDAIYLYTYDASIIGGKSENDGSAGIVYRNSLYIERCHLMDVKAGSSETYAIGSGEDALDYVLSGGVTETVKVDDCWYEYSPTPITIVLNGNGGSQNGLQSVSLSNPGEIEINLEDYIFTRSGYEQIGWIRNDEFIPLTDCYYSSSNGTLTAEWVQVDDNTVIFNALGGKIEGSYYKKTTTGSTVVIPDRQSTEYTRYSSDSDLVGYLVGWSDSSNPYNSDEDMVLCPESKWYTPGETEALNNKCVLYASWMFGTGNVINYHGNGGVTTAGSDVAEQINWGDPIDLSLNVIAGSTFAQKGYDFAGWKTAEGKNYSVGRSVTGDTDKTTVLDLYAQWTPATLKNISASFKQGQTAVYASSSLDSLKSMLTVTGDYSDSSTEPISTDKYTLSGTLKAGVSTITVNSDGQTTTFEVIVTEARASSGGGGGGGGSTVTSGSTAATTENWGAGTLTKITINIAAQTDKTGTATAGVTTAQIDNAISAVIKAAGKGSNPQSDLARTAVEIKVKPAGSASSVNTTIPQDSFKSLTKNSVSFLTISSPLADITFDAAALKTIGDNAAADITVKMAAVDKNTLSEAAKTQVGDRPVYDLAVTSGGKTISDFGGGTVTVSIPYTPAANEDSSSIVIYYISNQGELVSIPNCIYDPASGTVSFKTSHFSTYAVGYNKMNFSDVSGWFADAVNLLAARGVVSGTGEGRFSPNESVTRAQFAMMLAKLSGDDLTGYTSSSFSDVDSSEWYSAAVQWAYAKGVVSGWNGKFSPDAKISRQEIASMLARYADKAAGYTLPTSIAKVTFSDSANISDYANQAVTAMQRAGIINGYSNGSFGPNAEATRAEASKMIAALLQDMMQ